MAVAACKAQRLGEDAVVPAGKALQIPQALATAQDAQHRHQQEVPSRKANATPHPLVRDGLEIADQIEMGGGSGAFGHREETIPPTSSSPWHSRPGTLGQTFNQPCRLPRSRCRACARARLAVGSHVA